MPIPGWYTDPAGAPGRFRYWDGQDWSPGTTADPRDPPPVAPGAPPAVPARSARSRTPLVIGVVVAALVLVAAIAIAVIVRQPATVSPPVASASASGPTELPAPSESSPTPRALCPMGDPMNRQPPVRDNRIHGGGLSFPLQPDYRVNGPTEDLSWAYDVGSQSRSVDQTWSSSFAVGALLTTEGFETPRRAAELAMECTAPSPMYVGFTGRQDLSKKAVTVDGHRGYAIRSEIRVDNPNTTQTGDVVEIIVVDGDSPESLGMFWACVPLGDQDALAQLDRVVQSLRVD